MDGLLGKDPTAEEKPEDLDLPYITEVSEQTPDEQALVTHVKQKVEEIRATAVRIAHEGIWMENSAYLLGFAGLYFDGATRTFRPTDKNTPFIRRNRIHVNMILPTVQNRLAKLCKNPPRYDVRPKSNDTDDKEATRLSLQCLNYLWDAHKINRKRIPLLMWSQQCGHSYLKVSWDETKGNPMVDPMSGSTTGYEGDISVEICSAFEVFADPMAKELDDAMYLIHCKIRKLDYFKMKYPTRGHLVKEEGAWLMSLQYEQRIQNMNTKGTAGSAAQQSTKNSAIEMCYYERRSLKYPNGRTIIIANGVLLEEKELACGDIPFAKFDDIIVGGKYYSESIITHLRPIQDQKNMTIGKRSEWVNKLLTGKLIAARGTALAQESINNESGEIVYYTPVPTVADGGRPQPMQMPTIPQYAYLEEERLDKMFSDISGIGEVSRGTMPSASIPAIGMQLLTEMDDTRAGIITEAHEEAWAKVGQLILKYVEKYYILPRLLKISGRSLEYTVRSFKGSDLKGNTDVIVIRGSTLPGSKSLKRQDIENAYNSGLLGDPKDPKVRENVLDMMEFGDSGEIWQDHGIDMAQIKRGMDMLEQGMEPKVDELDNHAMWIQELNRFRKGDKWESLPLQIQNMYKLVIEQHIQWLVRLSGAPTDQTMAIQGAALAASHGAQMAATQAGEDPSAAALPVPQTVPPQSKQQAGPPAKAGKPMKGKK